MKRIQLITILVLFPLATLFAQVYEPDYDSIDVELGEQKINDIKLVSSKIKSYQKIYF